MSEQYDLFAEPEEKTQESREQVPSGPRIQYFDLETQKGAQDKEVGGWSNIHLMKLAVGVVWDSLDATHHTFLEEQAEALVRKLQSADLVVGFNVIGFDYVVLQPYASRLDVDLTEIPTFDMLDDIKKKLNFRLSLDHLAQHTLNAQKSASGLVSLQWYREAMEHEAAGDLKGKEEKMGKIVQYCKKDVEITRDLFEFGQTNGYVQYLSRSGTLQRLDVNWKDSVKQLH